LRTFWTDLKYGIRMMRKNPAFTAAAVIALALGIGANTAIFSVVNSVLLRPLAYQEPDRLVMVWENNFRRGNDRNVISPANYFDWKAQNSVFSDIAAFAFFTSPLTLSAGGDRVEIKAQLVTWNFFSVLGVQPALGRAILPSEDLPNAPRVVVISDGLWRRQFGSDPSLVGRNITLNGESFSIIGIMPPRFQFALREAEVWTPVQLDPARNYREKSGRWMQAVARLKPSVSLPQARSEMNAIAARLSQQYPEFNKRWGVNLVPVEEQIVGDVRRPLLILLFAVGFVLLIACANVANLQLARAAARQREISIRASLGAGRWRVVRQLLTESIALALFGGIAGLLLAKWGLDALIAASPDDLPRLHEISIDRTVLFFTSALSLLTGVVFGLVPAFGASGGIAMESLREGGRGSLGSRGSTRIRNILVVAEVALSLVLLAGAGLLIHSFARLQNVDPGFREDNLVTFKLESPRGDGEDNGRTNRFFTQAVEQLRQTPGVRSVSAINFLPFGGLRSATSFVIEGRPAPSAGEKPGTDVRVIVPGYFRTMGIPLLRGRDFENRDNDPAAPLRFVVNQAFARQFFPKEEVLGKRISVSMGDANPPGEIIGVTGDMKDISLDKQPVATVYYPYAHLPWGSMIMVARAGQNPETAAALKAAVAALNPAQAVPEIRAMGLVIGETLTRPRFYMLLLAVFAGLAATLAAVGIYGVISYMVTQRTHEIGLRMALGAKKGDVLNLVVGSGALLGAIGIGIGLAAGLAVTRTMTSLLFEVQPYDISTFAAVAVALGAVTLLAAYLPARRAARVDPMIALRHE
jgi:putative ABC transport system permease protein